jgi:hypothetical protein
MIEAVSSPEISPLTLAVLPVPLLKLVLLTGVVIWGLLRS